MNDALIDFFNSRKAKYFVDKQRKVRLLSILAVGRLVIFILGLTSIVFFSNQRDVVPIISSLLSFSIIFIILVIKALKVKEELLSIDHLIEINQNEVNRIERRFDELCNGEKFLDSSHPFSNDLAIFGDFSLFQLVNRTCTKNGKELLAAYFKMDIEVENIKNRQEAIRELVDDIDWRQKFEASNNKQSLNADISVLAKELIKASPTATFKFLGLAFLFPLLLFGIIVHGAVGTFSYNHLILATIILSINGIINFSLSKKFKILFSLSKQYSSAVKDYSSLFSEIRRKTFVNHTLNHIKDIDQNESFDIELCLNRLSKIIAGLSEKGGLISAIFLTDLFWILKQRMWRQKYGNVNLKEVFRAVNEMEVLISLSGFSFANPEFSFPDIKDSSDDVIEMEDMGHPLIKKDLRINNDLKIAGTTQSIILTGPNMSGKSTFLKAVGVNIVLALSAAPVCAKKFSLMKLKLFVSTKTSDNLKESTSSFYAEIKRIEQLVRISEKSARTFYIIDEIFKGTNSNDQIIGAIAVLRHLRNLNAIGIMSTHNSQLAMYAAADNTISCACFESLTENEEVKFDYKIRVGVAKNLTACSLIKRIGIDTNIQVGEGVYEK